MTRLVPVLLLVLLAPVTAEYLYGYDDSTGHPLALLAGLSIFVPLYGAPALVIREVVRRTGRGWPAMLLLGLAFGVVQAGLVDQSMFNTSYRDIGYWDTITGPTAIPALGISAYTAMTFTFGHMLFSIGAPIAVVEGLFPARRTTPWLGGFGLAVAGVLYVAASAFVLRYHLTTEGFAASPAQLVGASAVVVVLVVAAFVLRRLLRRPPVDGGVPHPLPIGTGVFAATIGYSLLPPTWLGVAGCLTLAAVVAVAVLTLAHRTGWSGMHRLAVAGGALLATAAVAFTTEPIGDVDVASKLGHNVALTALVAVLLTVAALATRRYPGRPAPISPER